MAKRKSTLAILAAGLGGAALAGFGLSMGRDLWRGSKKNLGFIVFMMAALGAVILPCLGGRELVRGHDRGALGTVFLTLIGSTLLMIIGFLLAVVSMGFILMLGTPEDSPLLISAEN
jgi:hypothetical protein